MFLWLLLTVQVLFFFINIELSGLIGFLGASSVCPVEYSTLNFYSSVSTLRSCKHKT